MLCELYSEQCDVRMCATCGSAKEYQDHKFMEIIKKIDHSKNLLQMDLQVKRNSFPLSIHFFLRG